MKHAFFSKFSCKYCPEEFKTGHEVRTHLRDRHFNLIVGTSGLLRMNDGSSGFVSYASDCKNIKCEGFGPHSE